MGRGCSYEGPNLKRYLTNVHVKKEHILHNQVGKYFAMGLQRYKRKIEGWKTDEGKVHVVVVEVEAVVSATRLLLPWVISGSPLAEQT